MSWIMECHWITKFKSKFSLIANLWIMQFLQVIFKRLTRKLCRYDCHEINYLKCNAQFYSNWVHCDSFRKSHSMSETKNGINHFFFKPSKHHAMILVNGSNVAMYLIDHAKLHCWYMKTDVCTIVTYELLIVLLTWQILIWFLTALFITVAMS